MLLLWTFIRRYALRYKAWYAGGLLALLATNALAVAIPWVLAKALNATDPAGEGGGVGRYVALIVVAAFGLMIVRTAGRMAMFVPGREAEFELRCDYFRSLLFQPAAFFRRIPTGDLLSRGSNDIQFIRALIGFASLQLLNLVFALPFNLVMMTRTDGWLTLGCVVPLFASVFVMWGSVWAMMTAMRRSQEELAALSDEVLEVYGGVRVVQGFGAEGAMEARVAARNDRYVDVLLRIATLRSFLMPVIQVVGSLAVVVMIWYGGRLVATDQLHYGELSAFGVYVSNIVSAFMGLGWVLSVFQRGNISLQRVFEIIDEPNGVLPARATLPSGGLDLEVKDLAFTYPVTGTTPSLTGLSLRVPSGTMLGIFGATGSGKSTFLKLLARLETPPPGTVFLGGVDVCDLDPDELRRALSVVPQSSYLFSRSLRDNVAFGWPGPVQNAAVEAAVASAGLATDLASFPAGLDTQVGERGVTLSGGQRQRTALARAFYRLSEGGARVLLLDDVLSAVDQDTERRLVDSLVEEAKGRTTVVVSHRVAALRRVDQVVVLEGGRVVEVGPPEALIAAGGRFAEACLAADQDHHQPEAA